MRRRQADSLRDVTPQDVVLGLDCRYSGIDFVISHKNNH
jgi:hypothetical protein